MLSRFTRCVCVLRLSGTELIFSGLNFISVFSLLQFFVFFFFGVIGYGQYYIGLWFVSCVFFSIFEFWSHFLAA